MNSLLSQMILREKISLLAGKDGMNTPGILRFLIPTLEMANRPVGVGGVPATYFGAGISFAAIWDTTLIRAVAKAIGAPEGKADGSQNRPLPAWSEKQKRQPTVGQWKTVRKQLGKSRFSTP